MDKLGRHAALVDAFLGIEDKNALAWSILDEKSERAVTKAIALSANRIARKRSAYVEYDLLDLVFVRDGEPYATYQAKAAYLTDYSASRVAAADWWLGPVLNDDFLKIAKKNARLGGVSETGCLFYLYEVDAPHRQLKYGGTTRKPKPVPRSASNAIEIMRSLVQGMYFDQWQIDCGNADGANVRIHMVLFEVPAQQTVIASPVRGA